MERDSARGAINPGLKILARFLQTGLGFSARPNRLENLKKISCNWNRISAQAEKQETIWLKLGSRSDFSGIKAIKERILFIVSNFKAQTEYENIDLTADKVKKYDAVRKALNSANLKISYLSLQVRLSS